MYIKEGDPTESTSLCGIHHVQVGPPMDSIRVSGNGRCKSLWIQCEIAPYMLTDYLTGISEGQETKFCVKKRGGHGYC